MRFVQLHDLSANSRWTEGSIRFTRAQALAAGLVLHMVQFIPVTVAGLLVLAKSGLKLSKIRESEEGLDT